MIYPDGTMDVLAHGVRERRPYTVHQQVTQYCITENIFMPEHTEDEAVWLVRGQWPCIERKDNQK